MLDELIEDGLLHICHPDGENWICLTGIYNVESVSKDEGSFGAYAFMRYYLGTLGKDEPLYPLAKDSHENCIAASMDAYKEFLIKNLEGLEAIKRIDTDRQLDNNMTEEMKTFLTTREWYENNKTIEESIKDCLEGKTDQEERININEKLLKLYKKVDGKYETETEQAIKDIEEDKIGLKNRNKLLNIMNECEDKSVPVQDFFTDKITA